MNNKSVIKVDLKSEGWFDELVSKYDNEADILSITSNSHVDWTYGIDIDGTFIFDFDKNLRLVNLDILVPKRLWQKIPAAPNFKKIGKGNLYVSKEALELKSFYYTNKKVQQTDGKVILLFEDASLDFGIYQISKKVSAIIYNNTLRGFIIEL